MVGRLAAEIKHGCSAAGFGDPFFAGIEKDFKIYVTGTGSGGQQAAGGGDRCPGRDQATVGGQSLGDRFFGGGKGGWIEDD